MNGTTSTPIPEAQEALLLDAPAVGKLLGLSASTVWRLHAAARMPRPIKLGGSTRFRADEIRAWVAAGCPGRGRWEMLQGVAR